MNVLGIDFTFFAVSDMQKSLTFYRYLLGIPLACLVHDGTATSEWARMARGFYRGRVDDFSWTKSAFQSILI